ncbi:MAG: hypothetical protein M3068_05160 [Gemmatimonadota bacterium]|nr:hypothetical protein [Gemmatimonadota bacterium]
MSSLLFLLSLLALVVAVPVRVEAQHSHGSSAGATAVFEVQGIAVVTRVQPGIGGMALTEGYLTQPLLMMHAHLGGGWLSFVGTADLEGLTLRRGELNSGIYGEGYIDRRHPHTYAHELIATVGVGARDTGFSLSAGKGFAPFGTDDPISRPFVSFPVNHHLAQVLERAVVIGSARRGRLALELGAFNGDEPVSPGSLPALSRFGDSWSARLTFLPTSATELRASHARIASPEDRGGKGMDQRKWSVAARHGSHEDARGERYALLEWARTESLDRGRPAFRFESVLGEAAAEWRGIHGAVRLERTSRPEEERLANPFRSVYPVADVQILGITRFTVASVALRRELAGQHRVRVRPFVELSHAFAAALAQPAVFQPADFYGSPHLWSFSAGLRLGAGAAHLRMGRYGAAAPSP